MAGAAGRDVDILHSAHYTRPAMECEPVLESASFFLPRLRACRAAAGLKQNELARRAGISAESVCRFEKLRRAAGIRTIHTLAQVLGVPPGALLSSPSEPEIRPPKPATKVTRRSPTERTCTDCGKTKPIEEFVPIRACKQGWYGRCRVCRAKRARERYQTDPQARERDKLRVRRTRERKRLRQLASASANSR